MCREFRKDVKLRGTLASPKPIIFGLRSTAARHSGISRLQLRIVLLWCCCVYGVLLFGVVVGVGDEELFE